MSPDDNENDPLSWLGPVAALLTPRPQREQAAPMFEPTAYAGSARTRQLRPMERYEKRSAIERARERLERGRSDSQEDVLQDLDWHAWYYGYEPEPDQQKRRDLARHLYGEHQAMQLMAAANNGRDRRG